MHRSDRDGKIAMQKLRQWMKKWSFLISLLVTGVIFFLWTDNWQLYGEPLQRVYAKGLQLADSIATRNQQNLQTEETVSGNMLPDIAAGETAADMDKDHERNEKPEMTEPGEDTGETVETVEENTADMQPGEVVYHTVDNDYFDDAVFIGDSRTVGMYEYGGLQESSTFYASTGLTIYKMFDAKIVPVPGTKKKITVEEALTEKQFSKIYLMIGINEMGTGTVDSFMEAYGEAVEHLQELQPGAIIYLQAIMKVTAERSQQGDYITNEGIDERNVRIAQLADDQKTFYLDVNPLICDETGGMVASYTYDGVHLKAQYIPIWLDFLKEHAVE